MKKQFEEHFERTWLIIFLFMFVILMIPFPFFYIPAFGGIPLFLFGWFVHTAITFALIIKYYRMCMKRKEYHTYDEEEKK